MRYPPKVMHGDILEAVFHSYWTVFVLATNPSALAFSTAMIITFLLIAAWWYFFPCPSS